MPKHVQADRVSGDSVQDKLNLRQELFCQYFVKNSELFGNATLAYAEAYNFNLDELSRITKYAEDGKTVIELSEYDRAYNVCSVNSSKLLRNPKINDRKIQLLNELLVNEVVDAELARVIRQNYKLDSKIAAIREYNKLKQRVTEKIDATVKGSLSLTDLFNKSKE